MSKKVLASYFDDKKGMKETNLYDGNNWYAELSKDYKKKDFKALGGLPYKCKLKITYHNKTEIAMKGDVGAGGPHNPKIDIHKVLAKKIGFPVEGLDYVTIKRV